MKKERSINELLWLMLYHHEHFRSGLCVWTDRMHWYDHITWEEQRKLRRYIEENRPKNIYWLIKDNYYWEFGDINPRIKWIKKHIKRTEHGI